MRIILSLCVLFSVCDSVEAVSNPAVAVNPLAAGAAASYEFTFETDRQMNAGDIIVVQTNSSSGPNFSSSQYASMSPTSATISNRTQTSTNVTLDGVISNGATVTLVLNNIINPGNAGQGPAYTIRTVVFENNIPVIQEATAPGTVYGASSNPAVSTPIADQVIYESDGDQVVVVDLNQHFTDGDMDELTFTVDAGHDSGLVLPSIQGDALSLAGLDSGSTQVTIRASDLPSGNGEGEVTDTFDVRVVGELDNAQLQLSDDQGGATSDYTFTFNVVSDINTNHFVVFQTANGGSDFSNATIASFSAGSLIPEIFTQSAETIAIDFNSGSLADGGSFEVVFADVQNPSIAGIGPEYDITLRSFSPSQVVDVVTIPGVDFDSIIGTPTVSQSIDSASLDEADGAVVWVNDLNDHFTDSDGDALTFTVENNTDSAVVDASINGSQLFLSPLMNGTTTVTVQASDLPSGNGEGTATTNFNVTVLGELESLLVTPLDVEVNALSDYEVSFIADDIFINNDLLVLTSDQRPDFSSSNTGSLQVTSNNLELNTLSVSANGVALEVTNSSVNPGDVVTFVIENATNPSTAGVAGEFILTHFEIGQPIAIGKAQGIDYFNSDIIFSDGFEAANR